jgi:hypothetical protein
MLFSVLCCIAVASPLHFRRSARMADAWCDIFGVAVQVDIIIDDSYDSSSSNFPDIATFIKAYGLTPTAAAAIPAIKNGQVG